jgi:predicted MPP superfamily phosphohydrolase
MALLPLLRRTAALGALAGAGLASYAAWEARQYTLRRVTVPLLPSGHAPMTVLHLSDIHMAPDQRAKQEWLRGLAALGPDLVVNTGDNLAHRRAVPVVADALGPLLDVPGAYVLGSNDYYSPGMRNPLLYLLPDTGKRRTNTPQLPWPELKQRFDSAGWMDLTNGFGTLKVGGTSIAFAGVDDPHLKYDDLDRVAGPADPSADLRLGVTHAPYLRVLDQFAADGYDAIIAGHTHGGQVCLPGGRALTTNCDLEPARARGLHRHPAGSAPGDEGSAWLHVSAGLGTNPYVRFRVACRPEATLLTLVPSD